MLRSIPLVLATLLVTASCAPISGNPQNQVIDDLKLDRRNPKGYCGNSSFENHSSKGSPLVADCLDIVKNMKADQNWVTVNLLLAVFQLLILVIIRLSP